METVKDRILSLCDREGITITKLEKILDLGDKTIRRWGTAAPNAGPLMKVADYFAVSTDFLLGREPNDEVMQYAEELRKNPDYRILFDATKGCTREEMRTAAEMIRLLRKG